jgi:hypothetical protein
MAINLYQRAFAKSKLLKIEKDDELREAER